MSTTTKAPKRETVEAPLHSVLAIKRASLEWIAADSFTTDQSYDRPADEKRINEMAENWQDEALGVVFASRREDEELLYLLDGQHRVGSLRKLGRKTELVPTLVFEGLSVPQEARLFVMMNKNRRALSPSELFYASIVEGDKGALEIKEVVDSLGLRLESTQHGPGVVNCVAMIQRVYRAMGAAGLDATLSLILVAWGEPSPPMAFHQYLVSILSRILYHGEGKVDVDHLRQVLAKEKPEEIIRRAQSINALQGGAKDFVLGEVILSAYNKGLPASKQLAPAILKQRRDKYVTAARFNRSAKRVAE